MNEPRPPQSDALAHLLQTAGKREDPPRDAYERTLEIATAAWHSKVRRRRRHIALALAAGIAALAVASWMLVALPPAPVAPVARVDRIVGTVEARFGESAAFTRLGKEARALAPDTVLRTRWDGLAGLLLPGDVSLRLAESTEISVLSASRIRLTTGKIYVDSGEVSAGELAILTPVGVAADIGTQFEVDCRDDRCRVRVREGELRVQLGATDLRTVAGEQTIIDTSGQVTASAIAPGDVAWQWAQAIAPVPNIDNRPLTVLLEWVGRETGRPVRYASADTERRASLIILHGDIGHLAPLDALTVMLATTDLRYVLEGDGTIMIR